MADPRDLKFFPSDVRLVDHYLRKRIETGNEGFIKDIKLYEDEPWLLPHVKNDLFNENEWFHFVRRTHKAGKTPKRTVPGRGGSSGGTWTSTSSKEEILKDLDGKKILIGHKAELSYYKHVEGHKKGDATGWCMTEYSLASENDDEFQEIVLCYIRVKKNKVESVSSTNRVLAPLEDIITMVDPSDLRFLPTGLKLLEHYLSKRVKTGKDGFIKDIKVYEEEPWLLPHVKNNQFIENEWFYSVERTCGSRKKRTVPGRGGSEGGTWTSSSKHKKILDDKNAVVGYEQELSYYKHGKGQKKGDSTGWCMTEYWLASDQNFVLCHIRVKKNVVKQYQCQTATNNNIVEQPPLDNNTVLNALVTGAGVEGGQQNMDVDDYRFMFDLDLLDFTDQEQPLMLPQDSIPPLQGQDLDQDIKEYANKLEEDMLKDEEDDDDKAIQQQHPQIPLPLQVQDSRSIMEQDMKEYANKLEEDMLKDEEDDDDKAIQQQHPQIPLPLQVQDSRSIMDQDMKEYANKLEEDMLKDEEDDDDKAIQQQHPQIPLPLQVQDSGSIMDQDMKEYADELENKLDVKEEEDNEKASQQQHPHIPLPSQRQDSGCIQLVIMEDDCIDQDIIFNLAEQRQEEIRMMNTFSEMQNNLYFQDSYPAEMYPWYNMMSNNNTYRLVFNTHGYQMQQPPLTNDASSCFGATQEQRQKRRKQC